MYWVNGLYTVALPGGDPGFQSANPGAGIANGTQITPAFLNDVQEELLSVPRSVGIVPAPNTLQLLPAIQALVVQGRVPQMYVFAASGTFTVPAAVTSAKVTVVGGGGGSGSCATGQGAAGGGAGGTAASNLGGLTPGAAIPVTVGAGGAGGISGTGLTGGTSSFGSYLSATGGIGGNASSASNSGGGGAGQGVGGTDNRFGGPGTDGQTIGGSSFGGNGGASSRGGGGRAGIGGGGGASPNLPQGVGGGAPYSVASNGYAGTSGIVIVEC